MLSLSSSSGLFQTFRDFCVIGYLETIYHWDEANIHDYTIVVTIYILECDLDQNA